MKYKKLIVTDRYKVGIYDNCNAVIYVREDGRRMRVERDTVKWVGNTGGYHRERRYVDGRDRVRRMIHRLRLSQAECLRMGLGRRDNTAVEMMLGNLV